MVIPPIFTLLALAALGHCRASLGSCESKFELLGDPYIATCAELDVLRSQYRPTGAIAGAHGIGREDAPE